jgi:hypothetical protein
MKTITNIAINNKPEYSLHANADWSGQYYGESLVKYFPTVPNTEINEGHWYFKLTLIKYHPIFDLYVFHINDNLSKLGMKKRVNFLRIQKFSLNILLRRIKYINEFRRYCSTRWSDIYMFLTQPVYRGIILC